MVERYGKTTLPLPCGKCLHCGINRRRMWEHRCMLESMAHEQSSFWTLTLDNEFLWYRERECNLDPMDLTRFLVRLRKELKDVGRSYRYFGVGEYGVPGTYEVKPPRYKYGVAKGFSRKRERLLGRPHYHLLLFGVGAYEKGLIEKCWVYGAYENRFSKWEGIEIGNVSGDELNRKTTAYCCGYTADKITKEREEIVAGRTCEFQKASTHPSGIGDPGLKMIADELKDNPGWDNNTIITSLNHGSKRWPLGRYLINRWIYHMDIPYEEVQRFRHEYFDALDEYCGNGEVFIENLMEDYAQKRKKQARIYKIRDRRSYL